MNPRSLFTGLLYLGNLFRGLLYQSVAIAEYDRIEPGGPSVRRRVWFYGPSVRRRVEPAGKSVRRRIDPDAEGA